MNNNAVRLLFAIKQEYREFCHLFLIDVWFHTYSSHIINDVTKSPIIMAARPPARYILVLLLYIGVWQILAISYFMLWIYATWVLVSKNGTSYRIRSACEWFIAQRRKEGSNSLFRSTKFIEIAISSPGPSPVLVNSLSQNLRLRAGPGDSTIILLQDDSRMTQDVSRMIQDDPGYF